VDGSCFSQGDDLGIIAPICSIGIAKQMPIWLTLNIEFTPVCVLVQGLKDQPVGLNPPRDQHGLSRTKVPQEL